MPKIIVTVELNSDYPDNPQQALARALRSVAQEVAAYVQSYQHYLVDGDGEPIGTVTLETAR